MNKDYKELWAVGEGLVTVEHLVKMGRRVQKDQLESVEVLD